MEREVERVFRDWDREICHLAADLTHLAAGGKTPISRRRSSPSSLYPSDPGMDSELCRVVSIERIYDKDSSSLSGDDTGDNSSQESVEDESRRCHYATCASSGRRMVRLQFDVHGFKSRDFRIKLSGRKLIIFAQHREADHGKRSTTEFCRKVRLPDDLDTEQITCWYWNGILTAEGPVLARQISPAGSIKQRLSAVKNAVKLEQLNTPLIRPSDAGTMVYLYVELGRVFRTEDVIVRLKGHDKLVITAQRHEENPKDILNASVTREFMLPERIYPHSLKAGLTHDGILNVTALVHQASPVNGEAPPVVTVVDSDATSPTKDATTPAKDATSPTKDATSPAKETPPDTKKSNEKTV